MFWCDELTLISSLSTCGSCRIHEATDRAGHRLSIAVSKPRPKEEKQHSVKGDGHADDDDDPNVMKVIEEDHDDGISLVLL